VGGVGPVTTFRRLRPYFPLLVLPLLTCDSPLEVQACPENSKWGTAGCAVLFVVLHEPEQDIVGSYSLVVSAALDGGGYIAHAAARALPTADTVVLRPK
jgi:hypothetical protein